MSAPHRKTSCFSENASRRVSLWAGVLAITRLLFLWHSANRATCALGRILISAVCPFHVQDGRFTVSTQHPRQLSMPHWHLLGGRSVSAPLPGLSPYALAGVALLRVGGVSSGLMGFGPKATRQLASPKCFMLMWSINVLGLHCVVC